MKRDLRRSLLLCSALIGCEIGSAPLVPPSELDVTSADVPAPDVIAPDVIAPDVMAPDVMARDVAVPDALAPDVIARDGGSIDVPSLDAGVDVIAPTDVGVDRVDAFVDTVVDAPDARDSVADRPDVVAVDVQPDRADVAVDVLPPLPDTTTMVPVFDAATTAHVRGVRALGATRGMRLNVFAKIGDSITESASFLSDIGFGWYELGSWGALEPTVRYFSAQSIVRSTVNSFNRESACAMGGWIAAYALSNDPDSALRRELDATHPGYALVMFGTNDLDHYDTATFRMNMERIIDIIEANGTVATISTIPDRLDRPDAGALVPMFNQTIRDIASSRHLPLMDYWTALQPLPRHGVDTDGIHPSPYVTPSGGTACGVLTAAGLRAGYNMRNLVALALLERLRNLP